MKRKTKIELPSIAHTYRIRRPNGEITEINCFDYNLAYVAGKNSYVQCVDSGFNRVNDLQIIPQ